MSQYVDRHGLMVAPVLAAFVEDEVLPGTVLEVVAFSHWNQNGPAKIAVDAWFEGPVSTETRLVAGPGEDVVLLPLASPLSAFRGRVSARVTESVEYPGVSKEVAAVPGEPILGGDLFFVSTQRFRIHLLGVGDLA